MSTKVLANEQGTLCECGRYKSVVIDDIGRTGECCFGCRGAPPVAPRRRTCDCAKDVVHLQEDVATLEARVLRLKTTIRQLREERKVPAWAARLDDAIEQGTSRPTTVRKSRAKEIAPRTYQPKPCRLCRRDFQPTGPRHVECRLPDCVRPGWVRAVAR